MYLGDGRLVQRQDNSEHPKIKYYLVQKLTDDAPTAPKAAYRLQAVEEVFECLAPSVELRAAKQETILLVWQSFNGISFTIRSLSGGPFVHSP